MNEAHIIKIILSCVATGILATPIFVVDRIATERREIDLQFASKESVISIKDDVRDIKSQQKVDHDLLIKIGQKVGVDR